VLEAQRHLAAEEGDGGAEARAEGWILRHVVRGGAADASVAAVQLGVITDASLAALGKFCRSLREIHLAGCNAIGDAGLVPSL